MSGIRFIRYQETPNGNQMGIATLQFDTMIRVPNSLEPRPFVFNLNYKVILKKDNSSFFPGMASYKIEPEGPGNYLDAFECDSNSMKKEIDAMIMHFVKESMVKKSQPMAFSANLNANHAYNAPIPQKTQDSASYQESALPF